MFRTKLAAVALAAVIPLTAIASTAGSADAATSQSKITASVSDKTPASGKAFNVSGTFTVNGKAAANDVVRVQTKLNGGWQPVKGARVTTNSAGAYKIKLILGATGSRLLRAVGVGQGSQPNAFQKFNVTVH